MQLGFAHRALEAQQEPIVEVGRIVYAVLVENQRVGEGADLQQPMPVGIVPREAGDLEPHDDACATHADIGHQSLKTLRARPLTRRTRLGRCRLTMI